MKIHATAVVDPAARIGSDVAIGPYCVIEPDVTIGDGCRLSSHVVVKQGTALGPGNAVHEGAVLGGLPQHIRCPEQPGRLEIGADNTIREHVTIHRSLYSGQATVVGRGNLLMVNVHLAHDCCVGDRAICANNVMLAGHVSVGDQTFISGSVGVHQFCRIGSLAMVGFQAHVGQDIPPFVTVDGLTTLAVGLNLIGLRRAGFTAEDITQLKAAYRIIYRSGLQPSEILGHLETTFPVGPAAKFHEFLSGHSRRGIIQERRAAADRTSLRPRIADEDILQSDIE